MSKRRKYDVKNKRSFIIIIILSVLVIGIFSLFIYKYSKASKIEYVIESGSVLQDVKKNYITVDDDAILKIRWNGDYYLVYNDKKINLGNKVISFNTLTGGMKLYGTFYEINSDGKIIENRNETILDNTTDDRFYKLDDREYLLIDSKIYSDDKSIEASNYLLVELDKVGNAKLSNNKINLKTINPTKLVTSEYSFDIANEILNFGEYDIDLKKIIGSTNQYVPESVKNEEDDDKEQDDELNNEDGTSNNEGNSSNIGMNNGGGGNGTGSGIGTGDVGGPGDIINNNDKGDVTDIGEIMDKIKTTSIIRIVEGITSIDIDYVVYDPYDEYESVYVLIDDKYRVDLSKNDTHIILNEETIGEMLEPGQEYNLKFVYSVVRLNSETGENESIPFTFDEFKKIKTKMPEYKISVHKLSSIDNVNVLTYRVDLQNNFNISRIKVSMSVDNKEVNSNDENLKTRIDNGVDGEEVSVLDARNGYFLGKFDISEFDINEDTIIKLSVDSVMYNDEWLPINMNYTFRFGR